MSSYGDGFYEGRKAGLQQVLQQGLDQVCQEATLAIARSLIGVLSVEVIAEKTGLSREVIEELSGK